MREEADFLSLSSSQPERGGFRQHCTIPQIAAEISALRHKVSEHTARSARGSAILLRARPLGEKSPRGNMQLGDESITEARVHWPTPAGKRVVQERSIAGIS